MLKLPRIEQKQLFLVINWRQKRPFYQTLQTYFLLLLRSPNLNQLINVNHLLYLKYQILHVNVLVLVFPRRLYYLVNHRVCSEAMLERLCFVPRRISWFSQDRFQLKGTFVITTKRAHDYHYSSSTYFCSVCGRTDLSYFTLGAWHCEPCSFDMCNTCVNKLQPMDPIYVTSSEDSVKTSLSSASPTSVKSTLSDPETSSTLVFNKFN
jgi:ribosomal protein L37AE/L43A